MTDIILREVKGYGWLPIIEIDGREMYRGEYQHCEYTALLTAVNAREKLTTVMGEK